MSNSSSRYMKNLQEGMSMKAPETLEEAVESNNSNFLTPSPKRTSKKRKPSNRRRNSTSRRNATPETRRLEKQYKNKTKDELTEELEDIEQAIKKLNTVMQSGRNIGLQQRDMEGLKMTMIKLKKNVKVIEKLLRNN
jgi:hypothetical protein